MTGIRTVAGAAAVLLALTASGCSSSSDSGSSSSPTSGTAPSQTPSPSPTTPGPAEEAQELAIGLVPDYLEAIDDLYLDPSLPLDGIYQVAVAPEATAQATACLAPASVEARN